MLAKQRLAEKRDLFQQRDAGDLVFQAVADIRDADIGRRAAAEQRQRQPGCVLVGAQPHRQPREEAGQQHAGSRAGDEAEAHAAAMDGGGEADDGRHQHHAFRPEVDDAGLFVDQQAERGQHQRRAGIDRGGDQGCQR